MTAYILKRLLGLLPVVFVVVTLSFILIHLTPGDPARMIRGEYATEESVQELREQLGLDDPLPVQYGRWLMRAAKGDLGDSLFLGRPVLQAIIERLEPTAMLVGFAFLISIVIGIPLGIIAAVRYNSLIDHLLMAISLLGVSMPSFWLGLNLILIFSLSLGWFAISGYAPVGEGIYQHMRHIFLPAFALGFSQAALVARITRTSMLDVLNKDFIRTARAKGLPERTIIIKHALKNAIIPIITVLGVIISVLIGGAVVIETVFGIPGSGRLIIGSVMRRDYPVVQGAMLVIAMMCVLINLVVDVIYTYMDPRIKYK